MLKNITQLTVEIEGKMYHLLCDNDSPIAHVKNALFKIVQVVGEVEAKLAAAQATPAPEAETPIAEVSQPEVAEQKE